MTELQRSLFDPSEEADVARIVHTLHRVGPLPLRDLHREPELVCWTSQRVERAVVSAWSRNLIFIDARDLLVAI
jgi:hypothetical protein